ncbi:MAG: hypothetical protein HY820_20715 [Acidobacteria bacterium]|nr:hypothetical protein [Acidobacteriota bacterium]
MRCVIALIAAACLGQQDHREDVPFDILVKLITQAARERFRPIMTYRIERRPSGLSWYEAKYALPGARTCRIFETPKVAFICEWDKPKAGTAAKYTYAEAVKQFEAALGAEWAKATIPGRTPRVRFTARNEAREGTIEIADAERGADWSLRITFYAMEMPE